jgi:FliG C-terminal domain
MAMVDRYKKPNGFLQLLKVMETCGPKKREQFMSVIRSETPVWAEALEQRIISFDKILSWKAEAILEVMAQVNPLAMVTALKSLSPEGFEAFLAKISLIERAKIERQYKEMNPSPGEINSCVMKVLIETRELFSKGSLKYDKIDPLLAIPDEFEELLEKGVTIIPATGAGSSASMNNVTEIGKRSSLPPPIEVNTTVNVGNGVDLDSLKKKVIELSQQVNLLKKENMLLRDKLDRIRKIA